MQSQGQWQPFISHARSMAERWQCGSKMKYLINSCMHCSEMQNFFLSVVIMLGSQHATFKMVNVVNCIGYLSHQRCHCRHISCQHQHVAHSIVPRQATAWTLMVLFHCRTQHGLVRYGQVLVGQAHFMLRFHYSLGTGVVTIVTQCRQGDRLFGRRSDAA